MIELDWQPEPVVRTPEIIVGFDTAAIALYHRLQHSLTSAQFDLQNQSNQTAGNSLLRSSAQLLIGNNFLAIKAMATSLPWVDGLSYLSTCGSSSHLYIPSDVQPNVPILWLEKALRDSLHPTSNEPSRTALQSARATHSQRHDLLYWPATNTLIQANTYWPIAALAQPVQGNIARNNLLTLWYEHWHEQHP
ncbi:MAG: hypothetical protein AAF810_10765 [Cyanobacteria bacterium P01_D01_bin.36]